MTGKSSGDTCEREIAGHDEALNNLISMSESITMEDGRTSTKIPFLTIIRSSRESKRSQGVLSPSFCLILQGEKRLYLGGDHFHYSAGDYLASMIDLPASSEIVGATEKLPYIGLRIDFTTQEIASVIMEGGIDMAAKAGSLRAGAFVGRADDDLLSGFERLLKLGGRASEEIRFLSDLIKKEMIFHLLIGEFGHLFLQRALFDQDANGVGKAIQWIKEHYTEAFTVEELAKACSMSVSGLHHKFKAVTTMGPLQYQKQLRLQEARRLMLGGHAGATAAALDVGYESPSQFNREYRRLFGLPPLQDIKAMRNAASSADELVI